MKTKHTISLTKHELLGILNKSLRDHLPDDAAITVDTGEYYKAEVGDYTLDISWETNAEEGHRDW